MLFKVKIRQNEDRAPISTRLHPMLIKWGLATPVLTIEKIKAFAPYEFHVCHPFSFLLIFLTVLKMKKFNFRKVLDGLTASSPGSGSSSSSNSGGVGSGSLHPGGTAGALREEIQESLTSDYFQICKVSFALA